MPYITQDARKHLDDLIKALADNIASWGELNYCITKLCIHHSGFADGEMGYNDIAAVTGVLENVKSEFYRKAAVPFEDKKCETNGEVFI